MNLNLGPIVLCQGSRPNDTLAKGTGCIMNMISFLQGDHAITDQPSCVHQDIRHDMMRINDLAATEHRQELIRFIPRLMQTATKGVPYQSYYWLNNKIVSYVLGCRSEAKWHDLMAMLDHILPEAEELPESVKSRAAKLAAIAIARAAAPPVPEKDLYPKVYELLTNKLNQAPKWFTMEPGVT